MKRVLTYGTYDLLHYGHINLLKRARALGDYLIVAISTDEFNKNMKNKVCVQSYEERKTILESLRFVDLVIPEQNWEQTVNDVQKYCTVENPESSAMRAKGRSVPATSRLASSSLSRMMTFCTEMPNVLRNAVSTRVCDLPTCA